jgi:hypothetical protein
VPDAAIPPSSPYDAFWPLGSGRGAWGHEDRIDVGPANGTRVSHADYTVRWGVVLDSDGSRLVLDGQCGEPGSVARGTDVCLVRGGAAPATIAVPNTASTPDHERGAFLLSDGRVLISNGLHFVIVHTDGTTVDGEVMPALADAGLVDERARRLDTPMDACQFARSCESGWRVARRLARSDAGTPEMELSWCKGSETCFIDTTLDLQPAVIAGSDALTWRRLNPKPSPDQASMELLELIRKKKARQGSALP